MDDSSDDVVRPKSGIGDLPDEVFVLILMLLPFPDQVRVRSVSKYWKTAIDFLFRRQEKVRISLQPNMRIGLVVREWELDSLGFNFDSGINIFITHPRTYPRAIPYCRAKEQAVIRFCSAVAFAIQYFEGTTIAEVSWGFHDMEHTVGILRSKNNIVRDYSYPDRDRMHEACNKFASRFQNQLLCFVCPLFDLTPDYFFPVLKHLTLHSVSHDEENMFKTMTPKLVSLLRETEEFETEIYIHHNLHSDNMMNLPADFRCLSLFLPVDNHDTHRLVEKDMLVYRRLRRCRTTIQSIRQASMWGQEQHDIHFQNLRLLQLIIWDGDMRENILTRNAAGLQHLQLEVRSLPQFSFPSHVIFHNLQSLVIGCEGDNLLDILSRTSRRLTRLVVTHCNVPNRRDFLTRLSDVVTFLTILQIELIKIEGGSGISQADFVLTLLRGGSRATLKQFRFVPDRDEVSDIGMDAIAAELRLMQESESLEVGIVNQSLLTAEKKVIRPVPRNRFCNLNKLSHDLFQSSFFCFDVRTSSRGSFNITVLFRSGPEFGHVCVCVCVCVCVSLIVRWRHWLRRRSQLSERMHVLRAGIMMTHFHCKWNIIYSSTLMTVTSQPSLREQDHERKTGLRISSKKLAMSPEEQKGRHV